MVCRFDGSDGVRTLMLLEWMRQTLPHHGHNGLFSDVTLMLNEPALWLVDTTDRDTIRTGCCM